MKYCDSSQLGRWNDSLLQSTTTAWKYQDARPREERGLSPRRRFPMQSRLVGQNRRPRSPRSRWIIKIAAWKVTGAVHSTRFTGYLLDNSFTFFTSNQRDHRHRTGRRRTALTPPAAEHRVCFPTKFANAPAVSNVSVIQQLCAVSTRMPIVRNTQNLRDESGVGSYLSHREPEPGHAVMAQEYQRRRAYAEAMF